MLSAEGAGTLLHRERRYFEMELNFIDISKQCPDNNANICDRKLDEFGIYPWCLEENCPHWHWYKTILEAVKGTNDG